MRSTKQPPSEAPLNGDQAAEAYLGALKECHTALMDTTDILDELAGTVIDFIDETDDIDPDTLKEVCLRAKALVLSTRQEFSLNQRKGVDNTITEPGIVSTQA